MAPLFVFMEILFALGYRPTLRKRIDGRVDEAIKIWKDSKKSK
jgi:uncharacterized membrane protein YGL010W